MTELGSISFALSFLVAVPHMTLSWSVGYTLNIVDAHSQVNKRRILHIVRGTVLDFGRRARDYGN